MSTTEQEQQTGQEMARREPLAPIPLHNRIISPDKWTTFGRMALTFLKTEFVPKDLRGRPDAVMACLVFGDSLGLHPSTALKEVFIADGKPGISGALMTKLIRDAGHKIIWEEIRGEDPGPLEDGFIGWKCTGQRIERRTTETGAIEEIVTDEDSWTYTMGDAKRAGLYPHSNPKAAWMKTPKVMCRWRALAQVGRFLFSDVFMGQAIYLPEEAEEAADADRRARNGEAAQTARQQQEDERDAEYGDDPLLAAYLVSLFAAANELEPGRWLPKKIKLTLGGLTQEGREDLAAEIARWVEERGGLVPERPQPDEEVVEGETIADAEFEEVSTEGLPEDDPGTHLDGGVEIV